MPITWYVDGVFSSKLPHTTAVLKLWSAEHWHLPSGPQACKTTPLSDFKIKNMQTEFLQVFDLFISVMH